MWGFVGRTMLSGGAYGVRRWGARFVWVTIGIAVLFGVIGGLAVYLANRRDPSDVLVGILLGVAGAVLVCTGYAYAVGTAEESAEAGREIQAAEEAASTQPERAELAWDAARKRLDAYFLRNLQQIDMIFGFSVLVMFVGFAVMVWGVAKAINDPTSLPAAEVATAAGVLTEFIGGTSLLIYRSAMQQATKFVVTLERMNSVGMAMKVLDTMRNADETELTLKTKADLVKLLIKQVGSQKDKAQSSSTIRVGFLRQNEDDED